MVKKKQIHANAKVVSEADLLVVAKIRLLVGHFPPMTQLGTIVAARNIFARRTCFVSLLPTALVYEGLK